MDGYLVALCTVGKVEEAHAIARMLVERRLAACVNVIGGVTSHYRWKGALEKGEEWLLVMKSSQDKYEELRTAILATHSYEVPEIIALPIVAGHPPYLDWIAESLA